MPFQIGKVFGVFAHNKDIDMEFSDYEKGMIRNAASTLRAVAHPLRVKILNFITVNQPVKVYDIHTQLNLDQSITSQQLKILREENLVTTSREGKNILYNVDRSRMDHIAKRVVSFDRLTISHRKHNK